MIVNNVAFLMKRSWK